MGSVYDWSTTASNNGNADSGVNWAESQAAASVNNSARAMMARIAELLKDLGAGTASTGASGSYLLTTSSAFTTYADGRMVGFTANHTNTGAATLNANSIGAKSIYADGEALLGGEIVSGVAYLAVYDAALNAAAGGWHLINPTYRPSWTAGHDEVGQYAMMVHVIGASFAPGDETSGANLRYANSNNDYLGSPTPTGTWKCLGRGEPLVATLYVKVA
jgi:hypothetical protein